LSVLKVPNFETENELEEFHFKERRNSNRAAWEEGRGKAGVDKGLPASVCLLAACIGEGGDHLNARSGLVWDISKNLVTTSLF
jgi:hypothetical protein